MEVSTKPCLYAVLIKIWSNLLNFSLQVGSSVLKFCQIDKIAISNSVSCLGSYAVVSEIILLVDYAPHQS